MTARPNPASPRAGVMRLSLLTHRTNRATANCLTANPLWVTQTSHDLHPENRGQTETQSGYPRSPPHRPSGTLLRWEAQFRRGTARNQCSALTVRGRHAVIQERESEGDGPPVLQVLPEGQSVRELLRQPHTPLSSGGRLRLRCPLRQGRPRRWGRVGPHPRTAGQDRAAAVRWEDGCLEMPRMGTLRTVEEIFGVTPMLGGASNATDLRDLFVSFP